MMHTLNPISKNIDEVLEDENGKYGYNENKVELHDNNVEDLDKYYTQEIWIMTSCIVDARHRT
jgi:hypothetical protein